MENSRPIRGKRIGIIKANGEYFDIHILNKSFQLAKNNKFIKFVKDSFVRKHGLYLETDKGMQLRYSSKGYLPVN
jgi:hypothetical protein